MPLPGGYSLIAQYGRPLSDVDSTVDRVRYLLLIGVLGGALLALIAGLPWPATRCGRSPG